jgi:NADPH:quinone reductase-like Zn-dependent oxidoreductase
MKAIVYTQYGSPDKLHLMDVAKPVPKDDEVLIKIRATSLNALDWHLLRADPFIARFSFGLLKPKKTILGADMAGHVEAVGKNVTAFKPGDAVLASDLGGLAEYICVPAKSVVLKPANLSFEQAAAVPTAALTALQGLRDIGKMQAGQQVLIHGASGGVGTFAVQIAKALGAVVTAVCSTAKVDMVRQLGADHVIDYTREDFSRNGKQYDLILAANGNRSVSDYLRALTPTGSYVLAGGTNSQLFQTLLLAQLKSKAGGKSVRFFVANTNQADLLYLKEMIEAGKLMPVMDRCYPLDQTAEAMRYLEAGHAKGKIVIGVEQSV